MSPSEVRRVAVTLIPTSDSLLSATPSIVPSTARTVRKGQDGEPENHHTLLTTDEVKAMNRAPEAVDKAVDKAVGTVRRAEHLLVTGAEDVAARTRGTRRKLA